MVMVHTVVDMKVGGDLLNISFEEWESLVADAMCPIPLVEALRPCNSITDSAGFRIIISQCKF